MTNLARIAGIVLLFIFVGMPIMGNIALILSLLVGEAVEIAIAFGFFFVVAMFVGTIIHAISKQR